MSIQTILFDLDETLYSTDCGLWQVLRDRIREYMRSRVNIPEDRITELSHQYFLAYGTTLKGLELDYQVQAADYLDYVHDVPIHDYVKPDPVLRSILESLPQRKAIFTNANAAHTSRVLSALGVEEYFERVIDVLQISPYCKPAKEAFLKAISDLGDTNPSHYLLLDDSIRNIQTSLSLGMKAVLVNPREIDYDSIPRIDSIHDLPKIWPRLNGEGYV